MHISQQHSIDAFQKLEASFVRIRSAMGGYIAEGQLKKHHGLCTQPNGQGHFDVYEFDMVELKNSFAILCEIPK